MVAAIPTDWADLKQTRSNMFVRVGFLCDRFNGGAHCCVIFGKLNIETDYKDIREVHGRLVD